MKKLLIRLLLITSFGYSQPWTHTFKDDMIKSGLVDNFSLYHAGIGGIKTVVNEVYKGYNLRYAWHEEQTPTQQFVNNLFLAVLWEVGEYWIEGDFDYDKYCKMYGGETKMWRNNGFDVVLDCLVFGVPLYRGMYYDFKIWKHGFGINMTMEI